jgi:hypothetical protein
MSTGGSCPQYGVKPNRAATRGCYAPMRSTSKSLPREEMHNAQDS